MNNKTKQIFALLFVVATLLLMIGSVSATNAVELEENLEASIVVDDDASIDDDGFIQSLDDKVSSQTTNDDETIDAIDSVEENLNDINSEVVVSSEEQTTINAKDSNEDSLTDNPNDFLIIQTTTTPVVVVGDDVYFDIYVENLGPQSYTQQYVNLKDFFDPNELDYVGWAANPNPDGQSYPDNFAVTELPNQWGPGNYINIDYSTINGYDWSSGWPPRPIYDFQKGYCFNISLHFKALRPGQLNSNAQIWTPWGDYWGNSSVIVGSNNFNINKTTSTPVVKVGENVSFDIFVQNIGPGAFTDGQLVIKDIFDPDELEYLNWTTNTQWGDLYHVNAYNGLIEIRYDTFNNWLSGYSLNFTLHFKTKKDGQLNNSARIETYWGNYTSADYVLAGEPNLTIIKTPREPIVNVGDDVYFDVYIENTGTLPVTVWWLPYDETNQQFMWIDDWYDLDGLEFVNITFNPDKNGNRWDQNYQYADQDPSGTQLLIHYLHYGNWQPGDSLNFTTHFKAKKTGQLNNSVHMFWKWKYWGDEDNHKHIEVWGNASVLVGVPDFTLVKTSNNDTVNVGDMVTFTLNYTNTGDLTLTGVYIKDNEYANGLVYSDYSDKDLWTFDGTDTWYYNSELAPGESAILELTFQATTAGEMTNTATAGHNLTEETFNGTGSVLVEEDEPDTPEEPDEPEEEPDEPEEEPSNPEEPEEEPDEPEEEPSNPVAEKAIPAIPATGNPVFVLLISLVLLCFVPLRGKK